MDPFSLNSPGFMNLLSSQSSQTIEVGSSDVPKPVERRKWTTQEDIVLISAWLNTSKDPIVSNQQKLGSFWKRITTRKHNINDGEIRSKFVVKSALRGISEEIRFVVICSS